MPNTKVQAIKWLDARSCRSKNTLSKVSKFFWVSGIIIISELNFEMNFRIYYHLKFFILCNFYTSKIHWYSGSFYSIFWLFNPQTPVARKIAYDVNRPWLRFCVTERNQDPAFLELCQPLPKNLLFTSLYSFR